MASSIGAAAFFSCTSLASVTIGNSVTNIGNSAFRFCTSLTNVTIGSSVTSIGESAFSFCSSLTNIMVDSLNSTYSSLDGVLFNKSQTTLIKCPEGKAGSYTIPNSVTSIGNPGFDSCSRLTNVIIPNSVNNIESYAFQDCTKLKEVYFRGNAPTLEGSYVFYSANIATIYYLPGMTGWPTVPDDEWAGRPTALWLLPNPLILNNGNSLGVQSNRFGFIISWATNVSVVVEACTNLANRVWLPVATNTLTGGTSYFSDPDWTNRPGSFYRLRSP